MCGENFLAADKATGHAGSPPRVWGKQVQFLRRNLHNRFTPTCVGKTPATVTGHTFNSVHPHVCGENIEGQLGVQILEGSPPRVWGKPLSGAMVDGQRGFTPTCVGKTRSMRCLPLRLQVHPHVCGENCLAIRRDPSMHGSPPRVWGKQVWPLTVRVI